MIDAPGPVPDGPRPRLSPTGGMATMGPLPPARQARLRSRAFLATVAILVATACGGSGDGAATSSGPRIVPTAAAFATVPAPVIVTPTPIPEGGTTGGPGATGEQTYTVASGDVLGSIAEQFNVSASQIRALNHLDTDILQIGQELLIPASTSGSLPGDGSGVTSYTVVEGDTAFGIALEFDTTVEALEAANGVAAGGLDSLQLGQIVKLPPPGER